MTDPTKETQAEFEERYDVDRDDLFKHRLVSMSCTCEDGGGLTHWAAITNTGQAIQHHIEHEECLEWLRKN